MRSNSFVLVLLVLLVLIAVPVALLAADSGLPRTASGHPDLSGSYNAATLTPLSRPAKFGDKLYMTPEEAKAIAEEERMFREDASQNSDPERSAPAVGGASPAFAPDSDPNALGAGNVGGYNAFWIDRGTDASEVDGKFRTSIIYDPPNGRQPSMTPTAMRKMMTAAASFIYNNDGTASWLKREGPGPFDGPESLMLNERCLLGFSGGPPMVPSLYNNYNTIVQTEDYVVILLEMVHDARIVRMNSEHLPPDETRWLGDSIGWWEDDTLIVDTTNFRQRTGLMGGDENMHVVERLTLLEDGDVLYNFTVDDTTAWTKPWSGEYVWAAGEGKVYEYACHEGNYAMGNILRGARLLEDDYRANATGGGK